eukprot:CAMPEP_0113460220 /NCGR_PEP_ID=MMETSP0014_2-20120614/10870_1 /TAXON_ID=2857 /ORGANISM="Nitzschia sp." /LENGTH=264 /DNA_ID=CAMNT_0000351857 /DNA_START=375 /DNA_END=1169 /DNA_ORIENTATION=- /assembly_acc=CAM_ASM_000159
MIGPMSDNSSFATKATMLAVTIIAFASSPSSPQVFVNGQEQVCKPVSTVENFNLTEYISGPWYIHQQMENAYTPLDQNYCVSAKYRLKEGPSFPWGYRVEVANVAQDEDGNTSGGNLCANFNDDDPSKLNVAPCFIPQLWSGPYWVVAYNETAGYALISGGQPDEVVPDETGCGGSSSSDSSGDGSSSPPSSYSCCRTGTGINGSGLWIFSRSRDRDEALISTVREIAKDAGFATSVLFDVNQTSCEEGSQSSRRRYSRNLLRH